jgi:hypothetical protein
MKLLTQKKLVLIGVILGAAYGIFARFIFGFGLVGNFFEVMSCAFVIGVPLALGFITIWFGEYRDSKSWLVWLIAPWIASIACLACALVLAWEGLICIILLLPLILVLSSIGGLIAEICLKIFKSKRDRTFCVAIVVLLPFAAAPIEQLQSINSQIRTVQTQIKIHANAETVWNQIRSVSLISEKEQHFSFSHMIGFPRPLEAKLVGDGVGAVRYATFEKGVLFVETINEWDEPHRLAFLIRADTKNIPPKTFDEHVIIGGKYFDVLNGTYWIEEIGNGDVILHLSSSQRLSTRFNFYSHFWTEFLMADLQNYILGIIKKRCETNLILHS